MKQTKIFDDFQGTPLASGELMVSELSKRIEDINPFENTPEPIAQQLENKIESVVTEVIKETKAIGKRKAVSIQPETQSQKPIPSVKQVILGNVPSKSNCYKIITLPSKDPDKRPFSSLGKTKHLSQYEKDFFIQAHKYRNLAIDEYFEFEIDVYYPTQKSDLDNSLKVVLDCLQKINAIKNDNKCTRIIANKFLDKTNPRIEFIIKLSMK